MRFIAAPWIGILENEVWLRNAKHANNMASRLYEATVSLPGVTALFESQANAVFLELPASVQRSLQERGWQFYNFIGSGGCRFMCSWDTTATAVDALTADIRSLCLREEVTESVL
jgi:threonine aldolase